MIITTTENINGYNTEVLGIVSGNTVRARHIGRDILAFLKNIIGGELKEYSELLEDARENARHIGADEIVRLEVEKTVEPPVAVYDPVFSPFLYPHPYRYPYIYPLFYGEYRLIGGGTVYTLKTIAIKYREETDQKQK